PSSAPASITVAARVNGRPGRATPFTDAGAPRLPPAKVFAWAIWASTSASATDNLVNAFDGMYALFQNGRWNMRPHGPAFLPLTGLARCGCTHGDLPAPLVRVGLGRRSSEDERPGRVHAELLQPQGRLDREGRRTEKKPLRGASSLLSQHSARP